MEKVARRFYVEVIKSKKNGKLYPILKVDLGYREINLSYDANVIAEILGVSVLQVYDLKDGEKVEIK